jgi:hypothetical protein
MRSKHFGVLLIGLLSMPFTGNDCGCVYAGDEVDYSAPYLTVENGELVTRYPAKEHAADDAPVEVDVDNEPILWLVWGLLAVIVVAAGLRRRQHR